jgi:hypothetical protein
MGTGTLAGQIAIFTSSEKPNWEIILWSGTKYVGHLFVRRISDIESATYSWASIHYHHHTLVYKSRGFSAATTFSSAKVASVFGSIGANLPAILQCDQSLPKLTAFRQRQGPAYPDYP